MMVADIDADCAQINDLLGRQSRERDGVSGTAFTGGNGENRDGKIRAEGLERRVCWILDT